MNFLAQKKIEQFLPRFEHFLLELQNEPSTVTNRLHVLFSDMFADWVATELYGEIISLENQKHYKYDTIALLSANLHAPVISSNMETIFTAIGYFAYANTDMLKKLSVCLAYAGKCSSLPVHFPQAERLVQTFFQEAKNKEEAMLDKINTLQQQTLAGDTHIPDVKAKYEAFLKEIQVLVEPITEKQQTLNQIEAVCQQYIEEYKTHLEEQNRRKR